MNYGLKQPYLFVFNLNWQRAGGKRNFWRKSYVTRDEAKMSAVTKKTAVEVDIATSVPAGQRKQRRQKDDPKDDSTPAVPTRRKQSTRSAAIDNSASANVQLISTTSGSSVNPALTNVDQNSVEFTDLKAEIHRLTDLVNILSTKLNYVLSYLEIDNSVITQPANRPPTAGPQLPAISKPSYASITARLAADTASVQRPSMEDAVAAVYVDIAKKTKRESNFIVSGILPSLSLTDRQQVHNLCSTEFDVQPDIVHVKRLGRSVSGKTQPLLVVVRQANQAQQLIGKARDLRQSTNPEVKNNVYINPNLTPAEAAAAFQLRAERRSSNQRRNEDKPQTYGGNQSNNQLNVSASDFVPLASGRPDH